MSFPALLSCKQSNSPQERPFTLSRELRASALCPGLEAQFPARRREERGCGPVTGKDRASCQSGGAPALRPGAVAHPLTTRRANQSVLKEISPEYSFEELMLKLKLQFCGHLMGRNDSLEGLMLKLKLQYFGHLMGRTDSLEKTLMLGKTEGRRRRG